MVANKYIWQKLNLQQTTTILPMRSVSQNDRSNPLNKKCSDLYSKVKNELKRKPYNINISFNINPKNIINQQIHKMYALKQDDYHQISYLRQAAKKEKDNSKFDCYMENQSITKANSRTKKSSLLNTNLKKCSNKGGDKNKSSQILLREKFDKLNKMKKSLLEKIGSMDITLQNTNQEKQKNNQYQQKHSFELLQLAQSKQFQDKPNQHEKIYGSNNQQDLITQKLSEYHPEELISFQNQRSQKQENNNQFDLSESFPMIFQNSMAIKRQYQKNYIKNFTNTNNQTKSRSKKYKKKNNKKIYEIKAPSSARLYNQIDIRKNLKIKSDSQLFNKIKVMHQKMVSSQSFRNLYNSTQINDNENQDGKKQKQFIIKTEDQFIQIKNQIQFYYKKKLYIQQSPNSSQKQKPKDIIDAGINVQGLENEDFRPTQQIIQSYVYQMNQAIQFRKLKEQISHKKYREKSLYPQQQNQNQIQYQNQSQNQRDIQVRYEKIKRKRELQKQQSSDEVLQQGQKQVRQNVFQNQFQSLQKNQLYQSSSNGQRHSQSEPSFTFILNQAQLIAQKDSHDRQIEHQMISRENPNQSIQDSYKVFQNIQKTDYEKKNLDSYFQQQNQVYLKKGENSQFQYYNHLQQYKGEQMQRQNSDVDSFIYGMNQFDQKYKMHSSSSSQIIQQDQEINKRLDKVALERKMREQLQIRLINLRKYKTQNVQNKILKTQKDSFQNQKLDFLMSFIKNQLGKQEKQGQAKKSNIIQLVCQQIETMYQQLKQQPNQSKNQKINMKKNHNYQDKKNNLTQFQTPDKNQSKNFKQEIKNKRHNRNLSTQNRHLKSLQNSNDLTLWDLQILQSNLNKRYRDLSLNKQKNLQQMASDQNLDDQAFTKKIKELNTWERQSKAQIIKTKIKIANNMKQYIKIINDELEYPCNYPLSKSLSQQNIKPIYFKQGIFYKKNSLIQDGQLKKGNNKFGRYQAQLLEFKNQQRLYIDPNQLSQNSEQSQKDRQIIQFKKLKQRHTNIFKEDQSHSQSNSSSIENQQYDFNQTNSDEDIIKLQNQNQKEQFAELMNRPLFKLNKMQQDDSQVDQNFQSPHQLQDIIKQKKITEQQKLDIFQFIFLDLCIQIYQDSIDYQEKQTQRGKFSQGPQRILDSIWNFLKSERKKSKKKGPKIGIYTGLNSVKQYLQKISNFIMSYQEKDKDRKIIERLNSPLGPTALDLLRSMRFNTQYDYEDQKLGDFQNEALNSLVLPIYTFTEFQSLIQTQKQFRFQKYFDDQDKQKNRLIFLKNMTHVHHKAIFDALNETLDFQRPFGIWGKPFPWKKITKQVNKNQQQLKLSLNKSCQKVGECALYMCGLLVDKEQSLVKDASISLSYLQEVKEDRMSKLIINQFIQNQSRWLFLDDQQAEVLLEVSYIVWIVMLQEAIKQIKPFSLSKI